MILYFSGTGNSAYVARRIASMLQDEIVDLFDRIRDKDYSTITSDRPYVLVAPTYAWKLPRVVQAWIEKTEFRGNRELYTVLTCGSSIGAAPAYMRELCVQQRFIYKGCMPILMPENYIAMFKAPGYDESRQIISKAERSILRAAQCIENGQDLPEPKAGFGGKVCSTVVNAFFYKFSIKADPFYATEACIGCGICEQSCPMANIRLKDGKPTWGDQCTHCMACICKCPKEAIEYGKKSKGKVRYVCPTGKDSNDINN